MTPAAALQSLGDIEERIELLKTTLGLFAPGEPAPIAGELRELAEQILAHWLTGRGLAPAEAQPGAARLTALVGQAAGHDPALAAAQEPCRTILRLHGQILHAPDDPETTARLLALAAEAGALHALIAPRVALTPAKTGRG